MISNIFCCDVWQEKESIKSMRMTTMNYKKELREFVAASKPSRFKTITMKATFSHDNILDKIAITTIRDAR